MASQEGTRLSWDQCAGMVERAGRMSGTHVVKFVTFDGDQTLWDFVTAMRLSLDPALSEIESLLGRRVPELNVDIMVQIRDAVAVEFGGKQTTLEEMRVEAFRRTLGQVGADPNHAPHVSRVYQKHRAENTLLYPDTAHILDVIGADYPLGVISNGNTVPDRVGLGSVFRVLEYAYPLGRPKPDPWMFEVACKRVGCQAAELLHVGDSLTSDVQGANAVGARSVWLNREGVPNETGIVPDFEVRALSEMPQLLAALRGSTPHVGRRE